MVFEKISSLDRYDLRNKKFTEALAFLKRERLEELPVGNFELCPGVIVQVQSYETEPAAGIDYETHDHHFDIHYVIHGLEGIGVTGNLRPGKGHGILGGTRGREHGDSASW